MSFISSDRDDLILYTITADSTLRVFLPVLDSPQQLQLHAALNLFSALTFPIASGVSVSKIFCLDRQIVVDALFRGTQDKSNHSMELLKRLQDLEDEGWDIFLQVLQDGSIVISTVAVSSPSDFG
jgi:hypothetical protein